MNYWHMQMNQPWGRDQGTIDSSEMLKESKPIIGTGDWENTQCDYFTGEDERGLKIGDIVLVREGQTPIALCRVVGDCFEDAALTQKYHHQYYRNVDVLDWYSGTEGFPMAQGTLGRLIDPKKGSWIFINNWFQNANNNMIANNIIELLREKKQIILQGPPGTGKTRLAKIIAQSLTPTISVDDIKARVTSGLKLNSVKDSVIYAIDKLDDIGVTVIAGTGKPYKPTYAEIIKAYQNKIWLTGSVEKGNDSYSAAIAKFLFENYRNSDNVKLIQFHPAYTYEDFVRGIRAEANDNHIRYVTENRIFAEFAQNAWQNYTDSKKATDDLSKEAWIQDKLNTFKETVEAELAENGKIPLTTKIYIDNIDEDSFKYRGDNWGNHSQINFSEFQKVIGYYIPNRDKPNIPKDISTHAHHRQTYYLALLKRFFDSAGKFEPKAVNVPILRDYILIIDEINRANLPAVLGELIYALEYRGEEVESLYKITNSRKIVVPPNLLVIATMNTADRSVGHIDYAIRRRFAFVDLIPTPEPIREAGKEKFKLVSSLFIKNYDQIIDWNEPKLERSDFLASDFRPEDVWIGHSYFITKEKDENGKALDETNQIRIKMKYEVIPILKEYLKDGILNDTAEVRKIINSLT